MTLLHPSEAASRLGIAAKTLASWRASGSGPPYTQIGRLVRYRADLLEVWIGQQTVQTRAGALEALKKAYDDAMVADGSLYLTVSAAIAALEAPEAQGRGTE